MQRRHGGAAELARPRQRAHRGVGRLGAGGAGALLGGTQLRCWQPGRLCWYAYTAAALASCMPGHCPSALPPAPPPLAPPSPQVAHFVRVYNQAHVGAAAGTSGGESAEDQQVPLGRGQQLKQCGAAAEAVWDCS